jgi:NADH pyrophosphatase NudC (nudix superfamily)
MAQPKFMPKPGQVDYTNIRYCPVVNCVVSYGDEILLQRRGKDMRLYPGCWSGVSGFLDSNEDIEEKIYEELSEEFGISKRHVDNVRIGRVIVQEAPEYGKTWIVFPARATLTKKIKPEKNWEVADTRWLKPNNASKLNLLPGFEVVLKVFFSI